MSTAKNFRRAGPRQEWIEVEDDACVLWRYDETNEDVGADQPYHVVWQDNGRQWAPVFIRDKAGKPILAQMGDGLPSKIIVAWDDPLNATTHAGIAQGTFIEAAKRRVFLRAN